MTKSLNASIIITTYNNPAMLALVLLALNEQDQKTFDVIVADDGSTDETRELILSLKPELNYPLTHSWQADKGFRAAKARNKAAARSISDYLIFLDGDSIPQRSFLRRHLALAESGYFVAGNRILLKKEYSARVVSNQIPVNRWGVFRWVVARFRGECNRVLPCLVFSVDLFRKRKPKRWKGAKTCNLGVWRKDFLAVNGFDESYEGWGYEDSDFVIRLIRNSVYRKAGRFSVPIIHLWHPENDRSSQEENRSRLRRLQGLH